MNDKPDDKPGKRPNDKLGRMDTRIDQLEQRIADLEKRLEELTQKTPGT